MWHRTEGTAWWVKQSECLTVFHGTERWYGKAGGLGQWRRGGREGKGEMK